MRGSHGATPPTRRRSRRPGGRAAASSSCARPSGSSASSRRGTARRCSCTGFDDLSPAQLRLLAALAGRCDVVLALPYEPGRPALGCARRRVRVARRRAPTASSSCAPRPTARPPASWPLGAAPSRRAASRRRPRTGALPRSSRRPARDGEAEAVAAEVCRLLRPGLAADEVLVVTPRRLDCEPLGGGPASAPAWTSRSTRASGSRACPRAMRCAASAACAWADGDRDDLFAWLRLAGSSWDRRRAPHESEARLRGAQHRDAARARARAAGRRPAAARRRADARCALRATRRRSCGPWPMPRSRAPTAARRAWPRRAAGVAARRALAAASAAADELAVGAAGRRR